jgi:hypothetical protein
MTGRGSQATSLRVATQLRKARLLKAGDADSADLTAAQQDYAAARIAELVEREMAKAPPLRPEQVAALRAVISAAAMPRTGWLPAGGSAEYAGR